MRALRVAAVVAAALAPPTLASAQVTTFICTSDAQVLKQSVNADGSSGGTTLWYTGNRTETFDDCVVGPDGWLYISSASSILRLDLNVPTQTGQAPLVSLVPSAARGLAFNVTTLYVNTATGGIHTLSGVQGPSDPLTFPDPGGQLFSVSPTEGHGVTFDVLGNLVLSSGSSLLRATVNPLPPFYTTAPTSVASRTATVFGAAVNTCGEIIYADKQSRSLRRQAKDGLESTLATFPNAADYPMSVEVDSNNNTYVLTVQSDAGASAKLWRVPGNLENSCAAANPTLVVDLSTLLSGPGKLKGLKSASALGVAVPPTDTTLTRSFTSPGCTNLYDFGYHTVRLTFNDCSVPFSVAINALKSRLSEVTFGGEISPSVERVPYSPLGGHVMQYRLNDRVSSSGTLTTPFTFDAQYGFYAQVLMQAPGLAKTDNHARTAPFTSNVMSDFWDVGVLDAAGGERGDDFSKRVIFNAPLTISGDCTIKLENWGQPFNTQQPLFKEGQTIQIEFIATTPSGQPCGGGGTMRISVAKLLPTSVNLLLTQSSGAAQMSNIMSNQGDKYWFNLDSRDFGTGSFQVTVWGDKIAPATRNFEIGR